MKSLYSLLFLLIVGSIQANNMLVQNVTTLGNDAVNKTIQVQFDISWDNSWRDEINYDAAWIFMKFKDASGVWQHVQLNQTGFLAGTGTANTVQVTNDKVGSWLYRSVLGSGTFNATGMQLQWNYGLAGLTDVYGLEVRVFAVEMVYVPEGDFTCTKKFNNSTQHTDVWNGSSWGSTAFIRSFYAPGDNFAVINNDLSPVLSYYDGVNTTSLRIKGDVGIDYNNDQVIENVNYPTGFLAFYCFKYNLSEQQFTDFLNTLTSSQISYLAISESLINGVYSTNAPNRAKGKSNTNSLLAYADWSGLRPFTFLEFNKASYGPITPSFCQIGGGSNIRLFGYPAWGSSSLGGCDFASNNSPLADVGSFANSTSTRVESGSSYYGIIDLTGSAHEPIVKLSYQTFSNLNGDGVLPNNGVANVSGWNNSGMIDYIDMICNGYGGGNGLATEFVNVFSPLKYGYRYVRSAE
jgi:hypothetical protein